jgi:hypothetical protein
MENLIIKPSKISPGVEFLRTGVLLIAGRSIMINPLDFYLNLSDWIKKYAEQPQPCTNLNIVLEKIHIDSICSVQTIFFELLQIAKKGYVVNLNWFCERDDEEMKETIISYTWKHFSLNVKLFLISSMPEITYSLKDLNPAGFEIVDTVLVYEPENAANAIKTDPEDPYYNQWTAVGPYLNMKESKPLVDKNTLFWICKELRQRIPGEADLYDYKLFSGALLPFELKEGNFVCTETRDRYVKTGCGNHCSVFFKISDQKTERAFYGLGQNEEGIIQIAKLLRKLAPFENWERYDKKK